MKNDIEYVETNREKAMHSSKTKFYCSGCDRNTIGQTGKCEVCGHRENRKKLKIKI